MTSNAARRQRLTATEPSVRAGAAWELWVERWLRARGARLEPHPAVPGLSRRPDLVAHRGADRSYVEATATGGGTLEGHRQTTPAERLHDVLMSRLKHKSRAFQGIDGPLLVAVLCIAEPVDEAVARGAIEELFSPANERGRNVSGVLVGWNPDAQLRPRCRLLERNPRASRPLPRWVRLD